LQRFIDDSKLYVANVRPGPAKTSARDTECRRHPSAGC
jgi:hypothetical protein